jgi:prepilin-type processing-associated H-X9-DG protein
MLEEFYYFGTNALEATVHFRHGGRSQVVFADGHVGGERPQPGSEDLRLSPQLLGRLAAERVRP